jgi:hypothetical protein
LVPEIPWLRQAGYSERSTTTISFPLKICFSGLAFRPVEHKLLANSAWPDASIAMASINDGSAGCVLAQLKQGVAQWQNDVARNKHCP